MVILPKEIMATSEADAARLAQLLGADSDDSDSGTEADQLRTTELLNRPSDAAEDDEDELDHKPALPAPQPSAPEPPAPELPAPTPPASAPWCRAETTNCPNLPEKS